MPPWSHWSGAARGRRRLEERLEVLRGTCFCLLYDLNAWLARAAGPVPPTVRNYRLAGLRTLPEPRERLRRYVSEGLVDAWDRTLQPFFDAGSTLAPHLGDFASLRVSGLARNGTVRAQLRISSHSRVLDRSGQQHALPERDWLLELRLSPDLEWIEDARLQALDDQRLRLATGRAGG